MTRTEAVEYVRRWAEAWNRRDIEAVLEQFAEDVVFSKPQNVAGTRPEHNYGSNNGTVRHSFGWNTSMRLPDGSTSQI